MQDVVIIGGGPAGITAAIYAARKQLDFTIISPDTGGQAAWASDVENYLGYTMISGFDLVAKFDEHVKKYGISVIDGRVSALEHKDSAFLSKLEDGKEFESRTVVVASGRSARNMGVPGEEEYKGKGVAYCATCDAPLFAGEDVAVVGGGNAGLSAAVQLSKIARHVDVIEEFPKLTGDEMFKSRLMSAGNVDIRTNTEVLKVTGNKLVEGISVMDLNTKAIQDIPVTGVFVEIGSLPNTGFLPKDVNLTPTGEIVIDCSNRSNVPGLFAAGDVTNVPHKQIIIAAGEGANALLSAYDYIVRNFPDGA